MAGAGRDGRCEQPTHGFAIAALLGTGGDLGRIWRVPKPVIYRAIARLEKLGLIRTAGEQHSAQGPVRSLLKPTPYGRRAAAQWLGTPVEHARDVRSELMIKLALLDRAGADPQPLLLAQQMQDSPPSPPRSATGYATPPGSSTPWPCGGTRRWTPPCGS